MKTSRVLGAVRACIFGILLSPCASAYNIIDLGTLGGSDSYGYAINDSGQVTGSSYITGNTARHAFLFDGSTMQDLGTLGGRGSIGFGINASGQVTGNSYVSAVSNVFHAFLYDGSTMQDLGTLGGALSTGHGINASGQVTGDSYITGNTASHAFLFDGSTMQDLGTLGGSNSFGYAINESGQVTGWSTVTGDTATHAFLYDGSTMQDLGTLGYPNSRGYGINASGQVVGSSRLSNGGLAAFLYDGSSMLDLCVLVDCVGAGWQYFITASEINDNGDITGYGLIDGERHAFLILPGSVPDGDLNADGIVDACCLSDYLTALFSKCFWELRILFLTLIAAVEQSWKVA